MDKILDKNFEDQSEDENVLESEFIFLGKKGSGKTFINTYSDLKNENEYYPFASPIFKLGSKGSLPFSKKTREYTPDQLIQLNVKLDKILEKIESDIVHKEDLTENQNVLAESISADGYATRKMILELTAQLEKRSYKNLLTKISIAGLFLSSFFLGYSILFGDLILNSMNLSLITIAFIFAFLISFTLRLSNKD